LFFKLLTLKILDFIINTNIFISVAAVALTMETQVQLGLAPQLHPYLFIIFFATLFEYNLHRMITIINHPELLDTPKFSWLKPHLKLFYLLFALSIISFVVALALAKKQVLITLAPFALITVFYSIPVYKNEKGLLRLREIPALKVFLIGIVWSAATILLPVIQTGANYPSRHIFLMLAERFMFILAITIPFDIRDIAADTQGGLKTLPIILGEQRAVQLANLFLSLFLLICILHYSVTEFSYLLTAFTISAFSTFLFINFKVYRQNRYYYYGILDGTMFLQGVLVCVSFYIVQLLR
jgi:4-hydroxybenzoate polyprenyltransferase